MKKKLVSVALLLLSGYATAQVGIGTNEPHSSALLDVKVGNNDPKRGILIPRVELSSIRDNSSFNNGDTPNSLLIFNTTNNTELTEGFYYWFVDQWIRLVSANDINDPLVENERMAVDFTNQTLFVEDNMGKIVSVPLLDVNILTSLVNVELNLR